MAQHHDPEPSKQERDQQNPGRTQTDRDQQHGPASDERQRGGQGGRADSPGGGEPGGSEAGRD